MRYYFILLCLLSYELGSQEINISGVVLSGADQTALVGAYVYPQSDPSRLVSADRTGAFNLSLSTPDTLRVSYLGFQEYQQYIDAPGSYELILTPSEAAYLDVLTVKARRIEDGELASQRISQMQIYLNPAAKADPLLAVNSLPAATNPDETANVSFRGSPSEATGIYLNEVPIRSAVRLDQSNGVGQFSIFGQIPLREVRVYPSSPPVNFSQTSAGAVGLYTSSDLPSSNTYGLSLSMAGIGLAHNRTLGEKSGIRAYLNYGNLSAFRFVNQEGLPELQRSRSIDGALQYVSQIGDGMDLQFFYLGFQESYRFLTRTPYYTGDFVQDKPRHLGVLNLNWQHEKWRLRFNQAIDWERAVFQLGNIKTVPRRLTAHSGVHAIREGDGFKLQLGSALNAYDDFVSGSFPTTNYALQPEDPSETYAQKTAHQLFEAYAYGQWRLGKQWLLGVGLKPIARIGDARIRPNIQSAIRYEIAPGHQINLSGGHFQQFLSPGPSIRTWQWLSLTQAALEYTFQKEALTLEAAVFNKREAYTESADLEVKGAELRLTIEKDYWSAWVSGTTVFSRTSSEGIPSNRDLPYLIRGQLRKQFEGQWTISLATNLRRGTYFLPLAGRVPIEGQEEWYSPIYAAATDGERLPDYQRTDLSVSKQFILGDAQLIIYLNCNNLLNTSNIRNYTYDATFLDRMTELYSRRLVFVGGVLQW